MGSGWGGVWGGWGLGRVGCEEDAPSEEERREVLGTTPGPCNSWGYSCLTQYSKGYLEVYIGRYSRRVMAYRFLHL